jgi:hypothetical protein
MTGTKTSNTEHPTPNIECQTAYGRRPNIRRWEFDVRCSMFFKTFTAFAASRRAEAWRRRVARKNTRFAGKVWDFETLQPGKRCKRMDASLTTAFL